MVEWTRDALFKKAAGYSKRAMGQDRSGPWFPYWAILSLEFLARAALAKVSPALLADPRNEDSLMFAFGKATGSPPSVVTSKVIERCTRLVDGFTSEHLKVCTRLFGLRNAELHSGASPYEGLSVQAWLPDYFSVCKVLLAHLEVAMESYFGKDDADAAAKMIDAASAQARKEVLDRVAACRKAFGALDQVQQVAKAAAAAMKLRDILSSGNTRKSENCPACGTRAMVNGDFIDHSEPRLDGKDLVYDINVLPGELECFACGLRVVGHREMHAIEMGGQYTITQYDDPVEYFGIEASDFYEPDPTDYDYDDGR